MLPEVDISNKTTFHRDGGTREVALEPSFTAHDIFVSSEEFETLEQDLFTYSRSEKAGVLLPNMNYKRF